MSLCWHESLGALMVFSVLDIKYRRIPNWIIMPAILAFAVINEAIFQTGVFLGVATVFGLYDFEQKRFLKDSDLSRYNAGLCRPLYFGGDAKLMAFIAATGVSWKIALLSIAVSWALVFGFRAVFRYWKSLPYAPFLLASYVLLVR